MQRQATLASQPWEVWVGRQGDTSAGTDDANRPVVTYVPHGQALAALTCDLKNFIDDVVANGTADMGARGTSQAFSSAWYLTDVFGGFQLWTGSDAASLHASLTCVIQ